MLELAGGPGTPAEVPYSQTRPDDEASEDDSESEAIRRPIPYLERDEAREARGLAPPRSKQLPHRAGRAGEHRECEHRVEAPTRSLVAALECGT